MHNTRVLKGRLLIALDGADKTIDLGPVEIPIKLGFGSPWKTPPKDQARSRAAHPAGKGDQFRRERGIDVDTSEIPIVKAIDDLPEDAGNVISAFFGYDGKD